MGARPFVSKGIDELETQFEARKGEQAFLKSLVHELSHRKTKRAHSLASKAQTALEKTHTSQSASSRKPAASSALNKAPSVTNSPSSPPRQTAQLPADEVLEAKKGPRPAIKNVPSDVLAAWTAMEVLSPSTFLSPEDLAPGERRQVVRFKEKGLPWENGGERSRPKTRLYYQIVLGTIAMEPAISALLKIYSDTRPERPQARGDAVLASITVDKEGRPVETDGVAISSFGWAVPVALSGQLKKLGEWKEKEHSLISQLTELITSTDDEGEILPLTADTISNAYEWLINSLSLDPALTRPPSFAIRTYQYFKISEPPGALILNSFFLDDLAAAGAQARNGRLTGNLKRYLGVTPPQSRRNLLQENAAIENALEPAKFPLGGWPGNGRHSLAMLQQCAVNLALHDLEKEGILAVNGPPGTGKTTLLRDVIAGIVTKRAEVLTSFSNPEKAFIHSGQKIKKGNAFIHLYELDDRIRGFEMIVASSNNKAVENVSAELPASDAIASDAPNLRYFSTITDNLLKEDSWGAIAAVLGNSANRANFRQDFWWDADRGLQIYLQHASGTPKMFTDNTGDKPVERPPVIAQRENPPKNHEDALRRWQIARRVFAKTLEEAKQSHARLQSAFDLNRSIRTQKGAVLKLDEQLLLNNSKQQKAERKLARNESDLNVALSALEATRTELEGSKRKRPGILKRLLRWSEYRTWRHRHGEIADRNQRAQERCNELQHEHAQYQDELSKLHAADSELKKRKEVTQKEIKNDLASYKALANDLGGNFIDDGFFEQDHKIRQTSAPWLGEAAARIRQDLFEAAMLVHRAFIDAAAKPIRHNLNALMDDFGSRSLGTAEKDALIPHLWSSLFLVAPVVSTTFASVSRMFSQIGSDAFGWLLIDEAGQALPQAAVGAIMRTRRAVVVGDPIQIEPVVVLPNSLTEAVCSEFGIDPLIYNAPEASAQTLSDSATAYFGSFETQFGTREVGVPLLVHRRCSDPMFRISNAIAYENLMVQAKGERPSAIRDALGASRWIHVEGKAQEKWCPEEGDVVLELLEALRATGSPPDLYIVTPFVIVQNSLRDLIRKNGLLRDWVKHPDDWVKEHVGTVHTVQGREAEAVIFVLGAPEAGQSGARGWAGGRPNLLCPSSD